MRENITPKRFAILPMLAGAVLLLADSRVTADPIDLNVLYSDGRRTVVELTVVEPQINSVYEGNTLYHRIYIPNEGTTFEVGKPELPVISRLVGILEGASCEVTVLHQEADTLRGLQICPLQPPRTDNGVRQEFVIDRDFYEAGVSYPGYAARLDNPGIWRDVGVVILRLYPVTYDPFSRSTVVARRLVVQISCTGGTQVHREVSSSWLRRYRGAILNGRHLNLCPARKPGFSGSRMAQASDSLKYLVIAGDEFVSGISPLTDWHHKRGIDVGIVPVCSLGTTPQEIKSYITEKYYTCGTEYVLFVGDVEDIPLHTWNYYPSQFWYACITGDSVPDIYPDLAVSRLSVKDTAELTHQVAKTLAYLKNPPLDEWLSRSILCAHREIIPDNYADFKERVRTYDYSFFKPICDTAYGRSNGTAAQVLAAINEGRNIVNYRGHGKRNGWMWWDCNGQGLWDFEVLALSNVNRPAIVLNMCCSNGAIQDSLDCMCETWMKAEGGAVATYGGTRCTFTEPHNIFDENFYKAFGDTLPGIFCVGDIIYYAYTQAIPYGVTAEENARQCVLLGDPLIEVGTGIPETLIVFHDSRVSTGDTNFLVMVASPNSLPVGQALVCIEKSEEAYAHGLTAGDGKIELPMSLSSPGTLSVTVTAHGYLPYEGLALTDSLSVMPDISIVREFLEVSPNPCRSCARIRYFVADQSSPVILTVYDVAGREVARIGRATGNRGVKTTVWDVRNVSRGVYFCRLSADSFQAVSKILVAR